MATKSRGRSLRRTALHQEIALRLRDMIEDGELPPGSRVPELKLCDTFEISRTPLREALKVLVSEGLVVHIPNRGFRVSAVEPHEIQEVFEVMGALEELAGQLICQRASDADIKKLEQMHEEMTRYHHQGKRTAYFHLNQSIHQTIVECAGNELLIATYASFSTRISRARSLANYSQLRWDESLAEHERFMTALRQRDGALMGRLLREHNTHTGATVLRELEQYVAAEQKTASAQA